MNLGSAADMKRTILIIFGLLLLSMQITSAKICNVADVKSTVKEGAYDFLTDPSSSQINPEDIRELYSIYSSSKDKDTIDCDVTSEKSKFTPDSLMNKIKGSLRKQHPATTNLCSALGGYSYTAKEYCPGSSISASDTDRCCSQQSVKGSLAVTNTLENGSMQATINITPEQEQAINISLPEDAVVINATMEITPTVNITLDVGADGTVEATIPAETTEVTPNLAPEINEFIDVAKENKRGKEGVIGAAIRGPGKISVPLLFKAESTGNVAVSKITLEYVKPKLSFFSKLLALIKSVF